MAKHSVTHGDEVRQQIIKFLLSKQVTISPVSVRDIGDEIGTESVSVVQYHLDQLEKQGKIKRYGKARMIKVLEHETG